MEAGGMAAARETVRLVDEPAAVVKVEVGRATVQGEEEAMAGAVLVEVEMVWVPWERAVGMQAVATRAEVLKVAG